MFENIWSLPEIFFTFGISLLVIFLFKEFRHGKNLPPGPFSLPFVGYIPVLINNPYSEFAKLNKKYGNIFSFRMGSRLAVVLNNGETIREALSKPEFLGRPEFPILEKNNAKSPFFLNGKIWSEHRRFALHALRDLGLGKSKMQEHVQSEIRYILECIQQKLEQPFSMRSLLTSSMSNNISSLVFGKRYDYEDPERMFLNKQLVTVNRALGDFALFACFPWLLRFPFTLFFNFAPTVKVFSNVFTFMMKKIKGHQETLDNNNARDVIDCYLIEKKNRIVKDPDTTFSDSLLPGLMLSLFGAGSNTVRNTTEWCIYIFAAYPEVQKKIQRELDEVVGSERLPEFADQKSMPYTQAVLQEIHRWKTIVPLNLLRMTLGDVEVSGYHIPKGTLVFSNLMATHHDPKCWDKPEKFIPERFLSEDGKTILKNENFMPFSYGKRSCPGEGFAILEVFLYATSILQKFSIKPANAPMDLEGEIRFAYEPEPQEVLFVLREN